jgi:hypothetical protein
MEDVATNDFCANVDTAPRFGEFGSNRTCAQMLLSRSEHLPENYRSWYVKSTSERHEKAR